MTTVPIYRAYLPGTQPSAIHSPSVVPPNDSAAVVVSSSRDAPAATFPDMPKFLERRLSA